RRNARSTCPRLASLVIQAAPVSIAQASPSNHIRKYICVYGNHYLVWGQILDGVVEMISSHKQFTTAAVLILFAAFSAHADGLVTDVAPHQWVQGASPEPIAEGAGLRSREDLEAFFDGVMAAQLKWQHLAGATVAVVKDGKLFFAKGYGYADVEQQIPV